jgi:DNA (cytosine-5)-methyltransferase 1
MDFESETFVASFAPAISASNPYGDHGSREGLLVTHALRADGFDASEDGTGRGTPLVPVAQVLCASCGDFFATHDEIHGLAPAECPRCGEEHNLRAVAYRTSGNCGAWATGDTVDALTTGTDPASHVLAFELRGRDEGAQPEVCGDGSSAGLLRASSGGSSRDYVAFDTTQITSAGNYSNPQPSDACHPLSAGAHPPAIARAGVRRLTPRECERLQGFPDNFTVIPWRGGMAPDGPRYKALGNSMAVPCMAWIGRRIAVEDAQ